MTWAQRLKRVFDIDVETCSECGGDVRIIASIEDPAVINKVLAHLDGKAPPAATALLPECRGPPQAKLFKGLLPNSYYIIAASDQAARLLTGLRQELVGFTENMTIRAVIQYSSFRQDQ